LVRNIDPAKKLSTPISKEKDARHQAVLPAQSGTPKRPENGAEAGEKMLQVPRAIPAGTA
jgi:hypothetical protein